MWTYKQSTGEIIDAGGEVVGVGYAGVGAGLNNPAAEQLHCIGPLPIGYYTIGPLQAHHAQLGANVAELMPDPANTMFGRSGFFLHGRKSATDMCASEGCIVQDHDPRMIVLNSDDRRLQVVA